MSKTFENSGSEKDFLKIYQQEEMDKYVRPSVTVDSVIFRYYEGSVQTLLIKRKTIPSWENMRLVGASSKNKKISI
ncbi:Nudix-related transcriptional regulator NrtR [Streptococcus sp. HSISS2]|nr:Nudix-related transcriptional regulator NrtR [Streptococcus sp. HSISS2]